MIHLKYKIWFAIRVEIEGYTGDAFNVCELTPTERCLRNIERTGLIVKKQPDMLTHLIAVNADGPDEDKPVYTPVPTLAFRYQLFSKGGGLEQRTNIDTLDPVNYILHLNNNVNNKVGSNLYLHRTGAVASAADRVFKGTFGEVEGGALAVADIFQNALVSADYRLQDNTGKCNEPVFVLRLAKHP